MLFVPRHGTRITIDPGHAANCPTIIAAATACGFDPDTVAIDPDGYTSFGYMFADAPAPSHGPDTTAQLDELADAMLEAGTGSDESSDVAAILTYLGQFIDHDITAGTDDDGDDPSGVAAPDVPPRDRDEVRHNVVNLRTGALDLDSVYGGAAAQGAAAVRLTQALRDPEDPAKMRIGRDQRDIGPRPALPMDDFADLPRIGDVIEFGSLTETEVLDFEPALRGRFVEDGAIKRHAALIGDGRNDENLAVASVHMAHLRLHNAMVDRIRRDGAFDPPEALFERVRREMRWLHQWLVVNAYLPSVCDPTVVDDVVENEAPLYRAFLDRTGRASETHMPLPLEFSAAAFRFGHSAARSVYDWNLNFNPDAQDSSFRQLQRFSSVGDMAGLDRLPSNWVVDMTRFLDLDADATRAQRRTKLIDIHVSRPLGDLAQAGGAAILKHLPMRNLRRAQRLAVPTAQGCLDALEAQGVCLPRLREDQIEGTLGDAARPFVHETPLWFYVLREAELSAELGAPERAGGLRLGPLGSRLVAEVLAGLAIHGPETYWTAKDGGRWHPDDGIQPHDEPIVHYPAMMRAAGLLPPVIPTT